MTDDAIPVLEPDAETHPITGEAYGWEPGVVTFARDLARHLEDLLNTPVTQLVYRTNPCDRRPCPTLHAYELAIGDHQVVVTCYETTHPLIREAVPEQAVLIDGRRIPFERTTYLEPLEWQLARAIWIAVTDFQIAAQRDATQAEPPAPGGVDG